MVLGVRGEGYSPPVLGVKRLKTICAILEGRGARS